MSDIFDGADTQTAINLVLQALTVLWWLFSSLVEYVLEQLVEILNMFTLENMEELGKLFSSVVAYDVGIVNDQKLLGGVNTGTVMTLVRQIRTGSGGCFQV